MAMHKVVSVLHRCYSENWRLWRRSPYRISPSLMLYVVWALTVNSIMWMTVWDMTVHSAVHRIHSLIGICSLHFEEKCYYVSISSEGITSIKDKNLPWGCLEHTTHSELHTFTIWTRYSLRAAHIPNMNMLPTQSCRHSKHENATHSELHTFPIWTHYSLGAAHIPNMNTLLTQSCTHSQHEHATHSELLTFPTWTPSLHLHKHPHAKYLSALYLLLGNLKYRKYKQLSDMLRYMKYTDQRAEQCSENGDSGFMRHHPVSFGWWFTTLQRNVVLSSSSFLGPLLHGSWSLEN
jgi:hypothetical protein